MALERLKNAQQKCVGVKEAMKAVSEERAQEVYIALDADRDVVKPLEETCQDKQVEVIYVDEMKELGEAAGIRVNATSACILK